MDFKFLPKGKITKTQEMIEHSGSTKQIFQNLTKEETEKKEEALQHYYVPYAVEALQDGFEITIFPDNIEGTNQLAIKYQIHNQNKTIILASTKEKNIQANEIKKTLSQYFGETVQEFASLQELEPEFCAVDLLRQGWELTKEGLDLFCTVRNDGEVEIRRTKYTNSEFANITQEEIQENQRRHNVCIEQQIIAGIPEYIVKSYKQITSKDIKEIANATPIRNVLEQYQMVLGYMNNQEPNELNQIFRNMQPILDVVEDKKTTLNDIEAPLTQISEDMGAISRCMKQIPSKYQDNEKHQEILRYVIIRDAFIKAKQKGATGKEEEKALKIHIGRVDEQEEEKKEAKRKSMLRSTETLRDRLGRGLDR